MTQNEEAHFFFTIQSFAELVKEYKEQVWYDIDQYFPGLAKEIKTHYGAH